jgi:hypothetical protein
MFQRLGETEKMPVQERLKYTNTNIRANISVTDYRFGTEVVMERGVRNGSFRNAHTYQGLLQKTVFEPSCVSLITEPVYYERETIVTEKTWITIANRQPFIMAGYRHNLAYLRELGYQTFENYLKINDYDNISDVKVRSDAVVENVENFLKTIEIDKEKIAQDVEHNYQLLLFYMSKTVETFDSIYRKLGTVDFEPFRIIPVAMQKSSWINFYYGIKDPLWPDCFSELDFNLLPVEIQKECIDVYGYTPYLKK